MLKLKLHYFGRLMVRTDSLEKTLMLGQIEDSQAQGGLECCSPWGCKELDMTETK